MNGVIVEYRGRRYRAVKFKGCTRRGCPLYRQAVCDGPDDMKIYPCDELRGVLESVGLFGDCTFKEIKAK